MIFVFVVDQIYVIDFSNKVLKIQNIINLESKCLKIIKDNQNQVIVLLQSYKLISISKSTLDNQVSQLVQLNVGLCVFTTTQKYIAFSDCITNNKLQVLEISSLNIISSQLTNQIVDLKNLGDNNLQIAILSITSLILFDLTSMSQIKEVVLSLPYESTFEIDLLYNRIFIVNQLYDTFVFNFNLEKVSIKNLESFGLNIQFDDKFIYYITSHSANIYFRKDLSFFVNFRQFNSTLNLQRITYLNVGYFFLVEFLEQISMFELSPFIQNPKLKLEIPISNYALIDFSLIKLNQNSQDYIYLFKIYGINFYNTFSYLKQIDLFSEQTQVCSQTYELIKDTTFDQNSALILNQQLLTLKQTLSSLIVKIDSEQIIRPPNIIRSFFSSSNFDLQYTSANQIQSVKVNNLFQFDSSINNLKLSNILLKIDQQNPSAILINPQKFKGLKKLFLENVILQDLDIMISDLNEVVIKNLDIQQTAKQYKISIQLKNIAQITIEKINISDQTISIQDSLIQISSSIITNIGQIIINQVQVIPLKSLNRSLKEDQSDKKLFDLNNIDELTVDILNVYNLNLSDIYLLGLKNINQALFGQINIQNTLINNVTKDEYFLNIFVNVTEIKIYEQIIKNIISSNQNQFTINKFSYLQSLTFLKGEYKQILISSQSDNCFVIFIESIKQTNLLSIQLTSSENIGLLKAVSLQITPEIIQSNNIINIQDIQILNMKQINQLIQIKSLFTNIVNMNFSDITISKKFQQSTITIQSDESISIKNLQAEQIKNNVGSFIQLSQTKNIILERVNFISVTSEGSASCIMINNISKILISECSFENNSSVNDSGSIYFKQINNISLVNSIFKKNKSEYGSGGAIYCDQGNFEYIDGNYFSENESKRGSGGAIYLINCEIKSLINNQFNQNSAFIGGAIRYQEFKPIILVPPHSYKNIKKSNVFFRNQCISYGKDIGSYPFILDVKNSFDDDLNFGQAKLKNIQSGYKSNEPLKIRFIDEEFNEVTFFNINQYSNINKNILNEFSQYFLVVESQTIGLLGELNKGYNFEQFAFTFDLSYSYQPEKSGKITIKSTSELPTFAKDEQFFQDKTQKIDIEISFRKCQIGEILQQQGNYTICYKCSQGFYNLVDPYSQDDLNCRRCPMGSIDCQGTDIKLMNGYWRENAMTDVIVQCSKYPYNCQPENQLSQNNCIEGHVGPLCLECDITGQVWGKKYGKGSNSECFDCEKFNSIANISIFILIFFFIFWQVFGEMKKQQSDTKKYILIITLKQLGFKSANLSKRLTETSSLIKILISYFQSVMIINSLDIKIFQFSSIFDFYSVSGGDPSKNTIDRIDCILFTYQTSFPVYVLKVFWVNVQPIALFFFVEIASQLTLKNRSDISIRQSLYTNLIITFSFFQPTITKVLSQAFSCREIGGIEYMLIDLKNKCLTDEHLKYILEIFIPLTIFWVLFIPLFLFWRLNHYKNQQNSLKILYRYSYLYIVIQFFNYQNNSSFTFYKIQEYRQDKFYWDIIKMFMRSLSIIVINVFNFNSLFKGLIILGLNFAYIFFQSRNKPYLSEKLNKLDQQSYYLVIQTLYLIFISDLSDITILKLIISAIILILNSFFLIKITKTILNKPINPISQDRKLKEKILFYLKKSLPKLFFWVQIGKVNKTNVFRNWKRVRKVISSIIKSNQFTQQYQKMSIMRQIRVKQQSQDLQKSQSQHVQEIQNQILSLSMSDMQYSKSLVNSQIISNPASPRNDKNEDSFFKFRSKSPTASSIYQPTSEENLRRDIKKSVFFNVKQ